MTPGERPDPVRVVGMFIVNALFVYGVLFLLGMLYLFLPEKYGDPVLSVVINVAVFGTAIVVAGGVAMLVLTPVVLAGRAAWRVAGHVRRWWQQAPTGSASHGPTPGTVRVGEASGPPPAVARKFLLEQCMLIRTVATREERREAERLLHVASFSYSEDLFWEGLVRRWSEQTPRSDEAPRAPSGRRDGERYHQSARRRLQERWDQRNRPRWG